MSLVAEVKDGKIVESTSASSLEANASNSSGALDKDAFLQLLVAEMQYQDPLEPTSNTEYISQFAQFSSLEAMQNMQSSLELTRASQLVGKTVMMEVTSSSGTTSYVQGKVDYIQYEGNDAYLIIDESPYSIDDLLYVIDDEYLDAYQLASEWAERLEDLPKVDEVTLADNQEEIEDLYNIYQNMTEYQKTFIASDYVKDITEYYEKIQKLLEAAEAAAAEEEETSSEESSDSSVDSTESEDTATETE